MRLDLIRHGDTGRVGHLDGRTDHPLSPAGVAGMDKQTAAGGWSLVIGSPLQRARGPAEKIGARFGSRVIIDADWQELDFGRWDGRRRADIERDARDRDRLAAYYDDPERHAPPEGERWADFEARVRRGLERAYAEAEGRPTLVVTHAGPMRMAMALVLGWPLRSLWAIRIGYATRIALEVGRSGAGAFWGEIVEVSQP